MDGHSHTYGDEPGALRFRVDAVLASLVYYSLMILCAASIRVTEALRRLTGRPDPDEARWLAFQKAPERQASLRARPNDGDGQPPP